MKPPKPAARKTLLRLEQELEESRSTWQTDSSAKFPTPVYFYTTDIGSPFHCLARVERTRCPHVGEFAPLLHSTAIGMKSVFPASHRHLLSFHSLS